MLGHRPTLAFRTLPIRIRSMAEHDCLESSPDVLRNTRTTHADLIARACVAPIRVNFHIEHYLIASVPCLRLPQLHVLLRDRGIVPKPPPYLQVLRLVSIRVHNV